MRATAKDLRFHVKELLEAVKRGEEVVITYRGSPCARLVPLDSQRAPRLDDSTGPTELFGIWRDHEASEDVEEYVNTLRRGRS